MLGKLGSSFGPVPNANKVGQSLNTLMSSLKTGMHQGYQTATNKQPSYQIPQASRLRQSHDRIIASMKRNNLANYETDKLKYAMDELINKERRKMSKWKNVKYN